MAHGRYFILVREKATKVMPMSIASTAAGPNETPRGAGGQRMQRRTYTIDEVSDLLGLSRNSAYVAARADKLPVPVIRVGKRMFVSRTALDRFLETGTAERAA